MTQLPERARPMSNVRVRRMQKLLREALIELIEEQVLSQMTIGRQLCLWRQRWQWGIFN